MRWGPIGRPSDVVAALLLAGCTTQSMPPERAAAVVVPVSSVDHMVVEKAARRLTLYSQGQAMRVIEGIQLGDEPVGPKHFEGDERTPEGRYTIDYRNPASAYHLSLHISYPDAADRAFAAAAGRSPGGAIFIHGQPNHYAVARVPGDWTDGCIALSDAEIEVLWRAAMPGATIDIRP